MIPARSEIVPLNQELAEKLLELSSEKSLHQYQNPERGSFIPHLVWERFLHPYQDPVRGAHIGQSCFVAVENRQVIGFAVIELNRFHRSECWFGPVLLGHGKEKLFWEHFHRQLREAGIWQLSLQCLSEADWAQVQKIVFLSGFHVNESIGWATAVKDISQSIQELYKGYDSKHRYSIERAKKLGLTTKKIDDLNEFRNLIQIFITMFDQRQIHYYPDHLQKKLLGEFEYIQATGKGMVLGSYKNEKVLGGIVLLFSGSTALYAYGAMDKNDKEPVMHAVIHHSFELLKGYGIINFDFGGYFIGDDDAQFIALNRFKNRFGVIPVLYPSRLVLSTSPLRAKVLFGLLWLRNKYLSLRNKHVS